MISLIVVIVIINDKNVYVVHVGDFRIVAGVRKTDTESKPRVLTIDHKPGSRREREREDQVPSKIALIKSTRNCQHS